MFEMFKFRKAASVATPDPAPATGKLFQEQAMEQLAVMLTRIPDPDEVLRKAGVTRQRLSMLMYDDEISQATETRLDALLTVPHNIKATEAVDKTEELYTLLNPWLKTIQRDAWAARLYGYSVMEAVYAPQPETGLIGLQFIGEKPMEWFEPKRDGTLVYYPGTPTGGVTNTLLGGGAGGSGQGEVVDTQYKFFLTRCKATYRNPYGEALLSRLYWAWYFRTNGWKFWGKFLERFGTPLLVGKSTNPKEMVASLLQAHSNAVIAVGRDDSVETVGAQNANGQAFELFEQAAVRRVQKVVLGQTLTSGTDGAGSRALGQVHETVRLDKRDSDIRLTTPTIQAVLDALCKLNGWPRHEIEFADGTGLEPERATRDKDLYAVGVRFTRKYVEENYDMNPEDFELASERPQPAGLPQLGDPAGDDPTNEPPSLGEAKTPPRKALQYARQPAPPHTPGQRRTDELADDLLAELPQPIDRATLLATVAAAHDPDDLAARLFAHVGVDITTAEWTQLLERALFAADVVGYVQAEKEGGTE